MQHSYNEEETFIYPDNLLEKMTVFGWRIPQAIALIASALISLILVLSKGMFIPLLFTAFAGILTFSIKGKSIYNHGVTWIRYLILEQQIFFLRKESR